MPIPCDTVVAVGAATTTGIVSIAATAAVGGCATAVTAVERIVGGLESGDTLALFSTVGR